MLSVQQFLEFGDSRRDDACSSSDITTIGSSIIVVITTFMISIPTPRLCLVVDCSGIDPNSPAPGAWWAGLCGGFCCRAQWRFYASIIRISDTSASGGYCLTTEVLGTVVQCIILFVLEQELHFHQRNNNVQNMPHVADCISFLYDGLSYLQMHGRS